MTSPKARIGYVGLGLMGGPMVERLLGLGWSVSACDSDPVKVERLAALGATSAGTPAEAAREADLILLNLPSGEAVEAVAFGAGGLGDVVGAGQRVVDFSTIEVERCRTVAARLKQATACGWIDAPVSGGPSASAAGTLTVMAGGEPADITAIAPLIADISTNFTHVGRVGDGLVAKMVAQLIVGCTHAVLVEAARLAQISGIDAAVIPACVAGGHADGELLRALYPRIVARDFAPRAFNRQLVKDMRMVQALARKGGMPSPMIGQALALYEILVNLGGAEEDVATLIKLYESDDGSTPHA